MRSIVHRLKIGLHNNLVFRFSKINRLGIARNFLTGEGIEIGALNYPLKIPANARVKYLDRISREEHLAIFKDIRLADMVPVDIIGNGETLDTVSDNSQDFVIANHFIEHCQDPVMTIGNMLRVLKKDGVIFMCIPDKRYTFDLTREETPMDHFLKDYTDGPAWSEQMHYEDFVRNTEWSKDATTDEDISKVVRYLKDINFSIHFHVWSHPTMLDFFQMLRHELQFPLLIDMTVAPHHGSNEAIFILRKV